ncbi:MAG: hypothetical protein M3Z06_04870 [Actinomycetota bacterium]|nr:hypothetical protein [Actinomycetota bacterium]
MNEDHQTEDLLESQRELAAAERRRASKSVDDQEALQHERRAEKAHYLSGKLQEQVEADQAESP